MKYSRTAIGLLTAQYRSVLKKCLLINLGLFALGAVTTAPANAADVTATVASGDSWTAGQTIGTVDLSGYADTNLSNISGTGEEIINGLADLRIGVALNAGQPIAEAIDGAVNPIKDKINVSSAGTYIAAGSEVANNLVALDTQVKINAEDIGTKLTGIKATSMSDEGDTSFVTAKQVADMNYLTGITSAQVTGALGFTPFNPANIIAADGEASTTNVYSASAIDTKLTGYATTATASETANGLMSSTDKTKLDGISTATTTSGDGYVTGELLGTTLSGYATTATATTSANGLMASTDKTKLDGISTATTTSGDGYVTGELLGTTLSGYATTATATTSANGLMASTDKQKLDGISTATTTSGDGYVTGALLGTTLSGYATTATATTSANGLMSSTDKSKLDGINTASYALIDGNNYQDSGLEAKVGTQIGGAISGKLTGTSAAYDGGTAPTDTNTYYTAASIHDSLKKADSALQSGANISLLTNDAGYAKISKDGEHIDYYNIAGNGINTQFYTKGTVDSTFLAKSADNTEAKTQTDIQHDGSEFVITGNSYNGYPDATTYENKLTVFATKDDVSGNGIKLHSEDKLSHKQSTIRVTSTGAYYAKDASALPMANNEIATIGTAKDGIYSGATTIAQAIASKQAQLTAAAGSNITLTNNTDGTVAISATDTNTEYTAGDGLLLDGTRFDVSLAANSGLEIVTEGEKKKLSVKKASAEDIVSGSSKIVTSGLLADQGYLKNGANSELRLDKISKVADLSVWDGSLPVAGININGNTSGAGARTITMGVYDGPDTKSKITMDADGAFYSKSETLNKTTDEIVTLGTAAKGTYNAGTNYGDNTIGKALQGKQATLTAANAGAGLAISDTNQVLSVGATDTSITVGDDGIAVKHDGSLAVDATNGLGVNIADTTITKDDAGAIKVGTIAQSQVSGLDTALAAKADINGTNYVSTTGLYGAIGTQISGAITAAEAAYAKLAEVNKFTANQQFGTGTGANFTPKAFINNTGAAGFAKDATTNEYALAIATNRVTANKDLRAAAGLTVGSAGTYGIAADGAATLGATTVSSLTMGSNTATGITPATGETTGLTLATANYAVEQAKAAADKVVKVTGGVIGFYKSADADNPEATTYTVGAINTKLADKYNWSAIVGTTNADDPDQNEEISANTHVYSQDKSDELLRLKMNTADWTLENDATKLDGAKLGAGTVGFAAINPAAISTSASVAAILADSHSVAEAVEAASDTKLVTEKAVFAGVGAMFNDKQNWMSEVLGYDTAESIANQLSPLGFVADESGNLGFLQAVSQNKTAIGNIVSANTKLAGIQMSDNSDDPSATKTVHKIDNSVIYDDDQEATGDEDVLATKATVLAALSDPTQDIVAHKVTAEEVDTQTLKVAIPADPTDPEPEENVILSAEYDDEDGNQIALNGATTINGATKVTGGLTADTLTLPNAESGATPTKITVSGIKGVSGDNAPMLITAGAVNSEFNTKVGTIMKETLPVAPETESTFAPASVQAIIGLNDEGKLVFDTNIRGVSNIIEGDGNQKKPTTLVEAFQNIGSAMGKIHGLVSTAGVVDNEESLFDDGSFTSQLTGETITTNLPSGTSIEEMEVKLDNAIGNIQAGNTLVGKAFADKNGKRIDTTYAKLEGGNQFTGLQEFGVMSGDPAAFTAKASIDGATGAAKFASVQVGANWQVKQMGNPNKDISFRTVDNKPVFNIGSDGMLRAFDGTGSDKPFFTAAKDGLTMSNSNGKAYMNSTADSFSLYNSTSYNPTFSVENATGDLSASKGKFTVVTDTTDDTKVKVSVAGDIEATGNVKAASLTLPNVGASDVVTATAIDAGAADDFAAATDAGTLATMASVNKLAEKAHYTNSDAGLQATTVKGAIDELSNEKFDKTDIVTEWSATTSDTKVASEKLVRDTLDDILDGDTPFTGFTMAKNTATSATDTLTMEAIDDGTYADQSTTTLATNATVKSAVNKLVFGGDPNTWTGVNIFKKQIVAEQGIQIGADYKIVENGNDQLVIRDVTTNKAKVIYEEGSLGLYATDSANNNSAYFTILNGSTDPNKVDGMRLASDGHAYFKALANQLAVIDPATNKINFSVENATGNVTAKGNVQAAGLTFDGTNIANGIVTNTTLDTTPAELKLTSQGYVDGSIHGDGTAGSAVTVGNNADTTTIGKSPASISVDTTATNHEVVIATAADTTKAAGMVADGDSVAIEATNGANDFYIGANAETDKEGVAMGVTKAGENNLLSGFSATATSAGMGLNDETSGKMTVGLSVEKVDDTKNVELGAFDNTDPNNPKLDTGVSVDSKGKKVSIAAAGNEVVNVSYDTTKGKGLVGVAGDLTATGNFSADNAGFTVSHNDTTGKTDVVATGDVKAASLTLPNANATVSGTITAKAIDNSATGFTAATDGTTLATLSSIQNLAAQGAYTPGDQNSWRNPYAGNASTKPTTIGDALDRLATNLDAATNSLGDWKTLDAYVHPGAGSPAYTGNITNTGSTPYEAPSAVSAIIDLDKSIGNRALYNATTTHYANNGTVSATPIEVSRAIANMDTKVYQDIHGTGTATVPAGHVKIGDNALTTTLGSGSYKVAVNSVDGQTVFGTGNPDKVVIKGGSIRANDAAGNQSYYKADGITVNGDKFTVDKNGNTVAAGSLTAAGGAFNVTPANASAGTQAQLTMNGNAQINGDESVTGKITVQATGSNAKVEIDHAGTITATDGTEIAQYDAAGITLNNGTDDTFTVDTTNGDMMAAAGNFAVTTADGSATSLMSLTGDAVISGDTKTTTFTMPDADQTGATSVKYAQVTGIDVGGDTTTTTFSNQALATTQSIKTKAENADYTASDALKAGNYATAQTSVATLNNAIEGLDLRIGDWDKLQKDNGNLTNGVDPSAAGYKDPTTVVEAFNNIDSTLGRIHGLVEEKSKGTYTYHTSSGDYTQNWTNLAVGTTVEEHILAVDTAIGNRNGYTAAYNIHRGESVAESLNNIDLRLGDVKSLNNMHYYGEQNPNDVNLTGAVRALDNNLYRVEHDLKTLRHDTYAGLASAAALSALVPNPRGTGDTTLSFGTGAYQGHTAAALGGFHWITNNLLVNAGVGWDNREATTRIGVSYSF